MKTVLVRCGRLLAPLALVAGCTAMPASAPTVQPTTAATAAPATMAVATTAPGSTEAAGSNGLPPAELTAAAEKAPAATEPPVSTPEPGGPPTTAPEPTLPHAATEAPTAAEAPAATAVPVACTPGQLTPSQTEGPYYKANPPETGTLLQPGMGGTKLTITGYVLDAACQPVPGARVDFWQADSEGRYDNQGYTLRGFEFTDAQGRYLVETVVPGLYTGRTRHIHVKVSAPGGPVLTTQLYFPNEAANQRDGIFSPELIMQVKQTGDGEAGTFNFVINAQ